VTNANSENRKLKLPELVADSRPSVQLSYGETQFRRIINVFSERNAHPIT